MAKRRNKRTKKSTGSGSNRNPNPDSNSDDDDDRMRFICDETDKIVIPVLPRFQAEVPEYKANADGHRNDPETSKWLGTVTWPITGDNNNLTISNDGENNRNNNLSGIGRGRLEGCNCPEPGSEICVKRHVEEELARQKTELGPSFNTWKLQILDETEDYFRDWSWKEPKKLMGVVNSRAFKTSTFLTKALKAVPAMSRRREILRYYFHILVPKRLSEQTRMIRSASDLNKIDSDDDEEMQARKEKYLSGERTG